MGVEFVDISDEEWPDNPVEITESEYDRAISRWPTAVVDYWAPWCGPCRMIAPILAEIAKEYHGKVAILKINVDTNPNLAGRLGIRSIPTVHFIKNGEVADQMIGAEAKGAIQKRISALLE